MIHQNQSRFLTLILGADLLSTFFQSIEQNQFFFIFLCIYFHKILKELYYKSELFFIKKSNVYSILVNTAKGHSIFKNPMFDLLCSFSILWRWYTQDILYSFLVAPRNRCTFWRLFRLFYHAHEFLIKMKKITILMANFKQHKIFKIMLPECLQ